MKPAMVLPVQGHADGKSQPQGIISIDINHFNLPDWAQTCVVPVNVMY